MCIYRYLFRVKFIFLLSSTTERISSSTEQHPAEIEHTADDDSGGAPSKHAYSHHVSGLSQKHRDPTASNDELTLGGRIQLVVAFFHPYISLLRGTDLLEFAVKQHNSRRRRREVAALGKHLNSARHIQKFSDGLLRDKVESTVRNSRERKNSVNYDNVV